MPPLVCHRLLLILLLWVAASHGDSSDDGAYDSSMCLNQTYTCGGVRISYPFYLSEETKDIKGNDNSYCGYPGLGILCEDDKPILQLSRRSSTQSPPPLPHDHTAAMPPLLLLLAVLLLFATANGYPSTCSNATCGGLTIAYPFWLNSSSASSCGYRGLGLACEGNTTLILPAQSHHRYRVSHIDYDTHTVFLVDDAEAEAFNATGCPHLHFNFTIDAGSALQLTHSDSNITFFYNCKKNASWPSAAELIGCPGYNKSSYASTGDGYTGEAYEYGCEAAVVAPVLDVHKKGMMDVPREKRYVEVLKGGFELNYSPHSEQCGACERSGGWCGYRHNQTHGVVFACFCDGGPTADQCGRRINARRCPRCPQGNRARPRGGRAVLPCDSLECRLGPFFHRKKDNFWEKSPQNFSPIGVTDLQEYKKRFSARKTDVKQKRNREREIQSRRGSCPPGAMAAMDQRGNSPPIEGGRTSKKKEGGSLPVAPERRRGNHRDDDLHQQLRRRHHQLSPPLCSGVTSLFPL